MSAQAHKAPVVDVALNVFAKPYQTALSLLSLFKFSGAHIDRVYLQFEPYGSAFDHASPYIMAEYFQDRAVVSQPEIWLQLDAADPSRLNDPAYRHSIRYQYAFEHSDKQFLLTLHNDVLVLRDMVGAMLEQIKDAFAIGSVGQCWNCPAARSFPSCAGPTRTISSASSTSFRGRSGWQKISWSTPCRPTAGAPYRAGIRL